MNAKSGLTLVEIIDGNLSGGYYQKTSNGRFTYLIE